MRHEPHRGRAAGVGPQAVTTVALALRGQHSSDQTAGVPGHVVPGSRRRPLIRRSASQADSRLPPCRSKRQAPSRDRAISARSRRPEQDGRSGPDKAGSAAGCTPNRDPQVSPRGGPGIGARACAPRSQRACGRASGVPRETHPHSFSLARGRQLSATAPRAPSAGPAQPADVVVSPPCPPPSSVRPDAQARTIRTRWSSRRAPRGPSRHCFFRASTERYITGLSSPAFSSRVYPSLV